jgi:hypothetical protein
MRVARLTLPAPAVVDDPIVCIPVNRAWIPVLMGAIARLDLAASWRDGTDMQRAGDQVLTLTRLLKNAAECEDSMLDVRQSASDPCKLEKTENGVTWVTWADLQACPPSLANVGGELFFVAPDGSYMPISNTPPSTPPIRPIPPRAEVDDPAKRCAAAANAVNVILGMHQTVFQTYFAGIVAGVVAAGLLTFIGFTLGIGIPAALVGGQVITLLGLALGLTTSSFTSAIQDELKCTSDVK